MALPIVALQMTVSMTTLDVCISSSDSRAVCWHVWHNTQDVRFENVNHEACGNDELRVCSAKMFIVKRDTLTHQRKTLYHIMLVLVRSINSEIRIRDDKWIGYQYSIRMRSLLMGEI